MIDYLKKKLFVLIWSLKRIILNSYEYIAKENVNRLFFFIETSPSLFPANKKRINSSNHHKNKSDPNIVVCHQMMTECMGNDVKEKGIRYSEKVNMKE